jgi:hypothetical protein
MRGCVSCGRLTCYCHAKVVFPTNSSSLETRSSGIDPRAPFRRRLPCRSILEGDDEQIPT